MHHHSITRSLSLGGGRRGQPPTRLSPFSLFVAKRLGKEGRGKALIGLFLGKRILLLLLLPSRNNAVSKACCDREANSQFLCFPLHEHGSFSQPSFNVS